ncbi:MAG TPA: hypothetical protein VFA29_02935 [Candidatus Baltobacteraceae bacterium]|nr:hypothetical protein [Candidatus Baltobacteraceae bacterium]
MEADEFLRARIPHYAGLSDAQARRLADEQVRAYAGERLAAMRDADSLSGGDRERLERLLMRAEFANQRAFRGFDELATPSQIDAVCQADADLVKAVEEGDFSALEAAFDRRDEAMLRP